MNLFEYNDYREFLSNLCTEPSARRGFKAKLAKAAGCQGSYFSQVLRKNMHLTEDQAIAVTEQLAFTASETEYFLLLLRFEKSGTPKAKSYFEKALVTLRVEQKDLSTKVSSHRKLHSGENLGKYFSSWLPSVVHLLTSSENFQTVNSIAKKLHLQPAKVQEVLLLLIDMGLTERSGEKFIYKGMPIHIPKSSPWQATMQTTRRQLAIQSISVNPEDALHFSSLFTISVGEIEKIKDILAAAVKNSHQIIEKSGTEKLCCICMDFFEVAPTDNI